jgi:hypothetical protein
MMQNATIAKMGWLIAAVEIELMVDVATEQR